ncbi:Nucleolar protein 9 [Coniosporium apollinis]|uniref:Nucleolar protein 9 n=1 Tax=Coniosporium apollinis TaxID=61459 RepID=A0ABQ9NVU9_9PEZI|nr:Nucleolar protein 9 [Coniosporium apollinis]
MPKENKKRGRREELKKRKRDHGDEVHTNKRRKSSGAAEAEEYISLGQNGDVGLASGPGEMPFYGMLDEEEQEYFKRADEVLELNQFNDDEERVLFLTSVYREAEGKELKMANSQSCSRLMERLIMLSSPDQLKALFQKFSGHFLHLVQHRFASHCCETLFIRSAPIVTQELVAPPEEDKGDPQDVYVSMENLFLYAINELEGNLGYLMTDKFASHTLRVLLVVLSGQPLEHSATKTLLQSKRKERIAVNGAEKTNEFRLEKRAVPESFLAALEKIIRESVSGLDTTYLRALATHPTGNPTLQLLLQLELTQLGKQRAKDEASIIRKLLPDDPIVEGTESASFINGLVYDTVGSRLLETIIEYAPGKMFKALYKEFFRERIGSLARNEIAAYVVSKLLERLSKEDLAEAADLILPQLQSLVERSRVAVIKTLIERCAARGVDTTAIAEQLDQAYGGPNGFDIARLLKLGEATTENGVHPPSESNASSNHPGKRHGSLLAQAMVAVPGPLSELIFESLARLGTPLALKVAKDPTASRTLQAALTSPNASIIFRRKMIQQFYGHIAEMALDPSASHIIDSTWDGTHGLAFIRERIAEELAENEASLRESFVGRAVWRNWKMDLYKRRRGDWVTESRVSAGNDGFQPFPEGITGNQNLEKKSGIELARQRHAAAKASKGKGKAHDKHKGAAPVAGGATAQAR